MKLRSETNLNSTPPPISKHEVVHSSETTRADIYKHYEHPWYKFNNKEEDKAVLIKPNPPTKEAIERARFKDKTFHWTGGGDSVRSGGKRSTK